MKSEWIFFSLVNFGLNCKASSSIADRGVMHVVTSIGLVIIAELETHTVAVGSASAQRVDRSQKDANGVTAANGVGVLLQIRGKTLVIQSLNDFHALEIKIRHRLEFIIAENTLNKVKLQFCKIVCQIEGSSALLRYNVNKLSWKKMEIFFGEKNSSN